MDDGISFGDVAEASPRKTLRPDRNKHFAVASYGDPQAAELPIFVDLDVWHDMEQHALSDPTVELGGVLLGGQYEDEAGRPFVLVTDSLRAQHYESTKGSFKFTHDTWSAIGRERDQFPPECQMVGWYHTHPDWGVFLSGMDMFICDNFFKRPLDVAYVIDPCRGDRGMFQWTGDPRQRVRRTGGFFVITSRFRQSELAQYIDQLSGKVSAMPGNPTGSYSAPVIQIQQPPPSRWQEIAVLGMLLLQGCFLALVAWKLVSPDAAPPTQMAGRVEQNLQEWVAAERLKAETETRRQVLDRVLAELKGAPRGTTEKLEQDAEKIKEQETTLKAYAAAQRQLETEREVQVQDLKSLQGKLQSSGERVERLQEDQKQLLDKLKKKDAEIVQLAAKVDPENGSTAPARAGWTGSYLWLGGGGLLALMALGIAGYALFARQSKSELDDNSLPPSRSSKSPEAKIGEAGTK